MEETVAKIDIKFEKMKDEVLYGGVRSAPSSPLSLPKKEALPETAEIVSKSASHVSYVSVLASTGEKKLKVAGVGRSINLSDSPVETSGLRAEMEANRVNEAFKQVENIRGELHLEKDIESVEEDGTESSKRRGFSWII